MDQRDQVAGDREIRLPQGTIRYRDSGDGPILVFIHGLLVNGLLWHDVVARLGDSFRCVVPDLPLGGHSIALGPGADPTPAGVARLVADLIATLDLRDVTLVGNDTGGAICQLVVTSHPDRITGLVLTNCDAYDAFLPLPIRPFTWGSRLLGDRFGDIFGRLLRLRIAQRLTLALVSRRRLSAPEMDAFLGPFTRDGGVRRDTTRFLRAISPEITLAAARRFPDFRHPVLVVWARGDRIFRPRIARRLAADFPDSRLELVDDSRAFVPLDRPDALADAITRFMADRQDRATA